MKAAWLDPHVQTARDFYVRHERHFPILFFVGGFLFDLLTLERIDSLYEIIRQALYLLIIAAMLWSMLKEEKLPVPDQPLSKFKKLWLEYRTELLHFLIGALLSAYTIFYFKSSSLVVSFGFMILMVALFIANELPQFRSLGLPFKFAILALLTFSYFACLIPTLIGSMGPLVFLFSLLVGFLPFALLGWWSQRRAGGLNFEHIKFNVLLPAAGVLILFLGAYALKIIPPVPLSVRYIGVYHSVDRVGHSYRLGDQNPWWRFWDQGDQNFLAQPQDKVYVFFRIFSPADFSDEVDLNWYFHDPQAGWIKEDRIPIKIVGGREEGFRGYGFKTKYQPGHWLVAVSTPDGREIGRIHFNLQLAAPGPRQFHYEIQ